ncbi:MAG: phosphoesterase [Acidobacteriota bacterium]|nr:phosphoesterase [Acidobacteriota bacterium]
MKTAASQVPNPTPDLQKAILAFKNFLERIEKHSRVVCLHDSDADGVTAGVVWELAMRSLGFDNIRRILPTRERNAWGAETKPVIENAAPDFLFVLDLGSQPQELFGSVPVCFIDHHRPGGVLSKDTLISAYNWNPVPNTSLIVYDLFAALADVSNFDWIAAIGTMSDLGERAPFELLGAAKKKYTAKYLKEATTLINAARRASIYEPETAAQALLKSANPKELVNSDSQEVRRLRQAHEEVKIELERAKKAAPKFARNVALLRINSPCQIHPLIAQIWRSRLPEKFIVICANSGFIAGRINFAARSHNSVNALDFLRSIDLNVTEGSYAQGHDQATGGSLPIKTWNELLTKLGFAEEMFASEK